MPFYSKLEDTAARLIGKYGQSVTLRQFSASGADYDPVNPSRASIVATFVDTIRKAIATDQPGNMFASVYGLTMEKGTLIQNKNKWLTMDAEGPQPQLQDHIILGGVEYTIISSQATSPGGTPVCFLLVLES